MITSFRMYNATPAAAAAWRALFAGVFTDADVDVEVIEHRWPQPIETLWQSPDLCGAFMCGWPFARSQGMQPIAAPVPSPAPYEGLPRYRSEFLARADSGWTRLEDAFGHRFGWMARNSHSGFNAPRAHLAKFARPSRPALFSQSVGPLGSPGSALEALLAGRVDAIALDGFYLDLVRRHEPAKLAGVRTIATTEWMPIPLLVAAPGIAVEIVTRLRERLLVLHEEPAYAPLLEPTLVARFITPEVGDYGVLDRLAREAAASGYPDIR